MDGATREDLEETGSTMILEESRGRQVRKYKMKKNSERKNYRPKMYNLERFRNLLCSLFILFYIWYKITLYPAKGGRDQGWSRVGAELE